MSYIVSLRDIVRREDRTWLIFVTSQYPDIFHICINLLHPAGGLALGGGELGVSGDGDGREREGGREM